MLSSEAVLFALAPDIERDEMSRRSDMNTGRYAGSDPSDLSTISRVQIALAMIRQLDLPNQPRVLDIASRDGEISEHIQKALPSSRVVAVDISEPAARLSRKRGITTGVCDCESSALPFADNSFDLVFAGELIEHLLDTDAFIQKIGGCLRSDGYLLLTTPNLASWVNRFLFLPLGWQPSMTEVSIRRHVGRPFIRVTTPPPGHIHVFVLRALQDLLGINGFLVQQIKGSYLTDKSIPGFIDRLIGKTFPSLASGLVVLARKAE